MQIMPFPYGYKSALQKHSKTMTLRVRNELGKYLVDHTYMAGTYRGKPWGILVRVSNVQTMVLKELSAMGINQSAITKLKKDAQVADNDKVEVITFGYV